MIARLVSRLLARLSTPALMRLGAVLGWVWYRLVPLRRADARAAVAQAFPEMPPRERERIVRANFVHLVRCLLETIAFVSYPKERLERLVRFEGLHEATTAARADGRGIICLSAHIGSFELCMGAYGIFHPEIGRVIIARVPKAGFAAALLEMVRDRTGIEVLTPKGSLPKVVRRVKEDRWILGFVVDQNMPRGKGAFVPFLGKLAGTTVGFSVVEKRTGAVVLPGWNERLPDGTHVGHWGPPVTLDDHPHPRIASLNDALRMNRVVEEWVRERPEQWFWVHRRWKSQPRPGDVVRTEAGLEVFGTPGRVGVILDRDGVINVEIGRGLRAPDELRLVDGAAEGIRSLNKAGIPVLVATNQAAIARGDLDEAGLEAIHERLKTLLANEDARIDRIYYCPHHPTEGRGAYRTDCDCRKPKPGLLKQAVEEWTLNIGASLFVGDRERDIEAARAAGMRAVAVSNGWSHKAWEPVNADEVAPDLPTAVRSFLDRLFEDPGRRQPRDADAKPAAAGRIEAARSMSL